MKTSFFSEKRSDIDILRKERSQINHIAHIREIMDAMPCLGCVLNQNGQIVFPNQPLMSSVGINHVNNIIGLRPGEALSCIHSNKSSNGCGSHGVCQQCGIVHSVTQCVKTGKMAQNECSITSEKDGQRTPLEFQVTCNPLTLVENPFMIMTLADISSNKRKELLERALSHKLNNQTSNLKGLVGLMDDDDEQDQDEKLDDLIQLLDMANNNNENAASYKEITYAESHNFPVNIVPAHMDDILNQVIQSIYHLNLDTMKGKTIKMENPAPGFTFETDPILLQKVLINMIRNAVEASVRGGTITIGYTLQQDKVTYFVHNDEVIPQGNKDQIFQRFFTTKEPGRGNGTHAMKLIGERYLKGNVGFESSEATGTRFFITLPQKFY